MSVNYCNTCMEKKNDVVNQPDCCHKICDDCTKYGNCLVCNQYTIFKNKQSDEELIRKYSDGKDVLSIEKLNLHSDVYDISFLSVFKNLKKLTINEYDPIVRDMSPISHLKQLKVLTIYNTFITDLNFLSELSELEEVTVYCMKNLNVMGLSKLTKLTKFNFGVDNIDFAGISLIPNLKNIHIIGSVNISSLHELKNSVDVSVSVDGEDYDDTISDLEWLRGVNVTELYLHNTNVSDLEQLKEMSKMTKLVLSENKELSSFDPIKYLVNLTDLIINNKEIDTPCIEDLTFLSGLTKLTHLELDGHNVKDLTPISGFLNLTYLSLISNDVEDLTQLRGFLNLTYLDLHGNKVSDLTPLSGLNKLVSLNLHSNPISDLSPLKSLTSLECLDLHRAGCKKESDLNPLLSLLPTLRWIGVDEKWCGELPKNSKLEDVIVCCDAWYY
jgi:Leucine-rich repeat (LRR) protein